MRTCSAAKVWRWCARQGQVDVSQSLRQPPWHPTSMWYAATLWRKISATKEQRISKASRMVLSPMSTPVPRSAPTLRAATFGLSPVAAFATSRAQIVVGRSERASHPGKSRAVDQSPSNMWYLVDSRYYLHIRISIYHLYVCFWQGTCHSDTGIPSQQDLLDLMWPWASMMTNKCNPYGEPQTVWYSALLDWTKFPTDLDRGQPPFWARHTNILSLWSRPWVMGSAELSFRTLFLSISPILSGACPTFDPLMETFSF